MGDVTRLLITGATGFVGRACVANARVKGLPVIALYRRTPCPEWADDDGVTALQQDLANPEAEGVLRTILGDCDAIIHAAAHFGDDPEALQRDTLAATKALLAARDPELDRMVRISSIAVYDTDQMAPGDTLSEASPQIADPARARDAYAGAKRVQERLLAEQDAEDDWILRPGAVWGLGRTWHALQGFWAGKLHVTIGSDGALPLVHVDHLADIAVEAARTYTQGVSVLNVFDDDCPTRARFLRAHHQTHGWPHLNITVPYGLWLTLVRLLKPLARRLPGLFQEPILRARMMPLRLSNAARRSLFANTQDSFEGRMARTREGAK